MPSFLCAGLRKPTDKLFLTTGQRKNFLATQATNTIYHLNQHTTIYRFPKQFFRSNFQFDRLSGIYRTTLTCEDVSQYAEVIDHEL